MFDGRPDDTVEEAAIDEATEESDEVTEEATEESEESTELDGAAEDEPDPLDDVDEDGADETDTMAVGLYWTVVVIGSLLWVQ